MSETSYKLLINQGGSDSVNLFNTMKFHGLYKDTINSYYFSFMNEQSKEIVAVARFTDVGDRHFVSIARGSFGGFEIVRGKSLSLEEMERFALETENFLRSAGGKQITITLPPLVYNDTEITLWQNILFRRNYLILRNDLNYDMDVSGEFVEKINYGNRKQLNKCLKEGIVSQQLNPSDYEGAYNVLAENRCKKGNTLSMTWESVKELCDTFPENVHFFGAFKEEKMIASAMCIRVNPEILYVFYWGEIAGVENLSPVTLLANNIFNFCLFENIQRLDVGISTLKSIPNYGLIRYKQNLGCFPSSKFTMSKNL